MKYFSKKFSHEERGGREDHEGVERGVVRELCVGA